MPVEREVIGSHGIEDHEDGAAELRCRDFCVGDLLGIRVSGGVVVEQLDLGLSTGATELVSFGEDADGEVYVLTLSGALYRLVPG